MSFFWALCFGVVLMVTGITIGQTMFLGWMLDSFRPFLDDDLKHELRRQRFRGICWSILGLSFGFVAVWLGVEA